MHINIWGAVCSKFFNKSQDSKNARDPNIQSTQIYVPVPNGEINGGQNESPCTIMVVMVVIVN